MALQDIRHLWNYIAQDNTDSASMAMIRIEKAVHSLSAYPELGRIGRVKGTRELPVVGTPYLVPYRIQKSRIEILAVIHGTRRWPEIF